ncbi:hypothetical protein VY86_19415 [Photorhabdus thracensis]|uniref:Uncharacterized protein n=2 Tax=Photorhabdus TaxID=29487 RepID=A0A0F7LRE5_9GAMM|nr:hypothetical protein VY86_19415 [Photorhabdus thracensis]
MTALPCRDVLCLHFTQFCGCEKFLEVPKNIGTQMTISFNGIPMYTTTIQTSLPPSFIMGANDKKQAISIVNTLKN